MPWTYMDYVTVQSLKAHWESVLVLLPFFPLTPSALIKVRPGSLHMVTLQGGSIGSYGDHQVHKLTNI